MLLVKLHPVSYAQLDLPIASPASDHDIFDSENPPCARLHVCDRVHLRDSGEQGVIVSRVNLYAGSSPGEGMRAIICRPSKGGGWWVRTDEVKESCVSLPRCGDAPATFCWMRPILSRSITWLRDGLEG